MKKNLFIAFLVGLVIVLCSAFIPKTGSNNGVQQPYVSEYVRTIEGHKYVVIVATNALSGYHSSSTSPSISVTCVHAESCPCKSKK